MSKRGLKSRILTFLGLAGIAGILVWGLSITGMSQLLLILIGGGLWLLAAILAFCQGSTRELGAASTQAVSTKLSQEHNPELFQERYRFIELLAETRFGKTYVAEDTQSRPKSLWVIKHFVPKPDQDSDLATTQRLFKGEAKVLEKLKTLQVVPQLLHYVEHEEAVWFIREYIIGHPLNEELIPGKPLAETQVIELLRGILQGLEAIHQFRIIHRDIKPSNIIRRKHDQRLMLIDFGAAKEWDPTQVMQPMMTVAIGTAGYTAYEQMMGQPLPASDIYSAGVIGMQAITGQDPSNIPLHRTTGEYNWRSYAKVSPPLAEILTKMLHTMFNERYQSAREVLDALAKL